jgi:hypothetical protein
MEDNRETFNGQKALGREFMDFCDVVWGMSGSVLEGKLMLAVVAGGGREARACRIGVTNGDKKFEFYTRPSLVRRSCTHNSSVPN